jgi:GntR family transcriptional repressor for pyruvate dehydrogenase complex
LHGFGPDQIFEARRMLELGLAGLAAERATSEQMARMAEEVTGMFATVDDPAAFMAHDLHFHRAVAAASGNPILAALVEMVSTLYFEHRRRVVRTRDQLREIAITHRNIYHAVRARDPERARREMSLHLPRTRPVAVALAPTREATPVVVARR